jgi:hypothetical protein
VKKKWTGDKSRPGPGPSAFAVSVGLTRTDQC